MCEPLLLANSYTHTLRPVRSRASTIAKDQHGFTRSERLVSWSVSCLIGAAIGGYGFMHLCGRVSRWVGDVVRRAYKFGGRLLADSAGCTLGRFSHWWRSVWVSVFGERGFHTSVVLASTVLLGCQKRGNCTLGQLMSPRSESVFFASFLCRFGQRNDVPPRTVANSDKEKSQLKQATNAESTNPAMTPTANART